VVISAGQQTRCRTPGLLRSQGADVVASRRCHDPETPTTDLGSRWSGSAASRGLSEPRRRPGEVQTRRDGHPAAIQANLLRSVRFVRRVAPSDGGEVGADRFISSYTITQASPTLALSNTAAGGSGLGEDRGADLRGRVTLNLAVGSQCHDRCSSSASAARLRWAIRGLRQGLAFLCSEPREPERGEDRRRRRRPMAL